jgi:hypothetical protein
MGCRQAAEGRARLAGMPELLGRCGQVGILGVEDARHVRTAEENPGTAVPASGKVSVSDPLRRAWMPSGG